MKQNNPINAAAKTKKPIYKKWWFWTIIVILVIGIGIGAAGGSGENPEKQTQPGLAADGGPTSNVGDDTSTPLDTDAEKEAAEPETNITMGQRNALGKADDYLFISGFSYTGLISQLEFEGYTNEEATYAADNCGADWNEQAARKAKDYLDISSFSRQGLIDQLLFEGFTQEQAEYGVTQNGY